MSIHEASSQGRSPTLPVGSARQTVGGTGLLSQHSASGECGLAAHFRWSGVFDVGPDAPRNRTRPV